MKTLKKTLCLVLAVVMAVGVLVIPTSAAYDDDADIKNKEAAAVLTGLKILEGDDDGNYKPGEVLTRAEAAVIISRLVQTRTVSDDYVGSTTQFTDVPANHWAIDEIAYCVANGIIAGQGDGTFDPDGQLTGHAFAKMVLCALGYDAENEGFALNDNWDVNVENAARKVKLNDGISGMKYSDPLSRDKAAQMAYNALFVETAIGYEGGSKIELPGGVTITQGATRIPGPTLAEDVYKVVKSGLVDVADEFKRPNASQVYNIENDTVYYTNAKAPLLTLTTPASDGDYTGSGKSAAGYAVTAGVKVYEDGVDVTSTSQTTLNAILDAELSGASVVELYGAKKDAVDTIVVINTYAGEVSAVTAATSSAKRSVTIDGIKLETEDYAKGDIVVYTKYTDTSAHIADNVIANKFTGTMTSYTNDNKFTVNSNVYTVSAATVGTFSNSTLIGLIGTESDYYTDPASGKIVYAKAVDNSVAATTDYAMIVDSIVTSEGGQFGSAQDVTVQVQAVLSNGQIGIFDLPVTMTSGVANYKVGSVNQPIDITAKTIESLKGKVYSYRIDGSDIVLLSQVEDMDSSTEGASGVRVSRIDVDSNLLITDTTNRKNVIQNNNTVYVTYEVATRKVDTKTGVKSLNSDSATGDKFNNAYVVVNVTKGTPNTYVAAVVFAMDNKFANAAAVDTKSVVYVAGNYSVSKDADGNDVYTYDAINSNGEAISAVYDGSNILTAGMYSLNSDGELIELSADYKTVAAKPIEAVSGTTIVVDSGAYIVDDTTKVVAVDEAAELEAGTTVCFVYNNTTKVVEVIFLTKAAE